MEYLERNPRVHLIHTRLTRCEARETDPSGTPPSETTGAYWTMPGDRMEPDYPASTSGDTFPYRSKR